MLMILSKYPRLPARAHGLVGLQCTVGAAWTPREVATLTQEVEPAPANPLNGDVEWTGTDASRCYGDGVRLRDLNS